MEHDTNIILNFFVGFLFIALPFLPGGNPLGFTWIIVGIFLIIIGTTGLYNKGSFPRNVYRTVLSLLALIELFLIIYIYINMPESHNLLFLIILGVTALLLYIVVYTLINKRKISKWTKGVEPVENDINIKNHLTTLINM